LNQWNGPPAAAVSKRIARFGAASRRGADSQRGDLQKKTPPQAKLERRLLHSRQ
jgi:hypothetical protein